MPLRLFITTYHKLTPGQRAEVELDRGELKIGRSAGNDWVPVSYTHLRAHET